jgi:hypothetical protein
MRLQSAAWANQAPELQLMVEVVVEVVVEVMVEVVAVGLQDPPAVQQ